MKSINERTTAINTKFAELKQKRTRNYKIILSSFCCILLISISIIVPFLFNNNSDGNGGNSKGLHNLYSTKVNLFNNIYGEKKVSVKNSILDNVDNETNEEIEDESEETDLLSYLNYEDTVKLFKKNNLISENVLSSITLKLNSYEYIVAVEYDSNLSFENLQKYYNYFESYYNSFLNGTGIYNTKYNKYNNMIFINVVPIYDVFIEDVVETDIGFVSMKTKTFIKLTSTESEITIPEGIEVVAAEAFYLRQNYTSERFNNTTKKVILPESIKIIDRYAFANCIVLEQINLPDSVEYIGDNAFGINKSLHVENLATMEYDKLPKNLKHVGYNAFFNTINYNKNKEKFFIIDNWLLDFIGTAETILIPENVVGICSQVFKFSNSSSLYIPASTEYIGEYILPMRYGNIGIFIDGVSEAKSTWNENCFAKNISLNSKFNFYYNYSNSEIEKFENKLAYQGSTIFNDAYYNGSNDAIIIDANVEFFESKALYFTNAKEFIVDINNPYFTSVNGVIYSKDLTTLVAYPNKKVGDIFVIPESVTKISDYAFNNCNNLKSITINKNIDFIGYGAFYLWQSYQTINIENDVIPFSWSIAWCSSSYAKIVWNYIN